MNYKKKEKRKWCKNIIKNLNIRNSLSTAKDKFSDFLELPPEVVNKITKITSIEAKDILIEGYKKIEDYYDNFIKIKTNTMSVIIDGKNLDIKEINDSELVIRGEIYSINYKK